MSPLAPIVAAVGATDYDLIVANKSMNYSILHDRVLAIDPLRGSVTLQLEEAYVDHEKVLYIPY